MRTQPGRAPAPSSPGELGPLGGATPGTREGRGEGQMALLPRARAVPGGARTGSKGLGRGLRDQDSKVQTRDPEGPRRLQVWGAGRAWAAGERVQSPGPELGAGSCRSHPVSGLQGQWSPVGSAGGRVCAEGAARGPGPALTRRLRRSAAHRGPEGAAGGGARDRSPAPRSGLT